VKSPGRPQTYDEDYDHIIKQVVDAKRALQQCASAKQIQDAMKAIVLRNMAIVKVDGRNFYDESMTKTMLGL
jgi:predicted alpha-1,6-mannanase (GH76 family)